MRGIAWVFVSIYLLITVLWIANSPYLFSVWGIIIWIISIVLGFFVYIQMKESTIYGKLLLYSASFMIFLLVVAGVIYWAVTSMP